ncbi:MAG: Fic family protein, partial [Clostridia bacterium]
MDRYKIKEFEEYKRQGEPGRLEKSRLWETAIGLQQVDGLTPSKYLIETAKEQIEGDITFQEAQARIHSYYKAKPSQNVGEMETEEADKVSAKIAEILADKSFTFSPIELQNIHKKLFDGIFSFAGDIRDYNITKDEWVLGGDTVYYASFESIIPTLQYDFNEEKAFNYKGLSKQQSVEHIAKFISGIWQIHPFGEGNTRTTAVFAIKYLRTLGFNVNNKLFAEHSWYFRNALVRASYNNVNCEAYSSDIFLIEFFENLLIGAKH